MNENKIYKALEKMPVDNTNATDHYNYAVKFELDTAEYLGCVLKYKVLNGPEWRQDYADENFFKECRELLLDKNNSNFKIKNPQENLVICQPLFQETPDVLVINKNNIVPIECKTTTPPSGNKKAAPRFRMAPRHGFLYAMYNKSTENLEIAKGEDFDHPVYDPEFMKHYQNLLDSIEKTRAHLKQKTYHYKNNPVKYRLKYTNEYLLSKGIC